MLYVAGADSASHAFIIWDFTLVIFLIYLLKKENTPGEISNALSSEISGSVCLLTPEGVSLIQGFSGSSLRAMELEELFRILS